MKNVIMMLWGMGLASGWWGLGLEFYHNGLPQGDHTSVGFAMGLMIVVSLITAIYSICKIIGCINRGWDD